MPKPNGPFRVLTAAEYEAALKAKNAANEALHRAHPEYAGKHIHEIQPVKFGGSPTDPANKIVLDPTDHYPLSAWWYKLQRALK